MIPKDVLKQIRRIEITTSRMVTDVFAGQYHSVFKGKGMEFDEVREYCPGDDIRSIDWNVTARTGHPYVKKFIEERELTVMILLDMSGSTYFGTSQKMKRQIAAELCSLLAFSAIKNNDKVGLIGFTDTIELFVPPRKGVRHILRIIREALYFTPRGKGTNLSHAFEYLNRIAKRKTVSFVISDFYADDYKKALAVSNKRHDIVALTITDPREVELPHAGVIRLCDAETGNTFWIDTDDEATCRAFRAHAEDCAHKRAMLFRSVNVDAVSVRTDIPYVRSLLGFFMKRGRKRG